MLLDSKVIRSRVTNLHLDNALALRHIAEPNIITGQVCYSGAEAEGEDGKTIDHVEYYTGKGDFQT